MTPKVRRGRIYWRTRGGVPRAWGDFRDFPDGKREPLVPPGDRLATTDPLVADILVAERVRALEAKRRGVAFGFDSPGVTLGAFAQEHLEQKARSGRTTSTWIATSQVYLERAVSYFGSGRTLHTIETVHVEAWVEHLRGVRYRGAPIAEGTVLQHLLVLSNLFRRAQKRKLVPLGHNPVWALEEKPQVRRREAAWLEVHEAALVLEAARLYRPAPGRTLPYTFPLIATFLLTGGRRDEVLGLQVEDVSFERKTVRFHPNPFRRGARGKSRHAERIVPLWPQLAEILGEYLATRPPSQLLFPAWEGRTERRLGDFRKTLSAVTALAGLPGEITSKVFRHTYCSARLQTLDRGEPVSVDLVRREMGHGDESLVRKIYGHLGTIRHRAPVVEFRADLHFEALGDKLSRLRGQTFGTTCDTAHCSGLSPSQAEGVVKS